MNIAPYLTFVAAALMLWAAFFHEDEDAKRKMENHTPVWERIWKWLRK